MSKLYFKIKYSEILAEGKMDKQQKGEILIYQARYECWVVKYPTVFKYDLGLYYNKLAHLYISNDRYAEAEESNEYYDHDLHMRALDGLNSVQKKQEEN